MSRYYYDKAGSRRLKQYAYVAPAGPTEPLTPRGWLVAVLLSALLLTCVAGFGYFMVMVSPAIGAKENVIATYLEAQGAEGQTPQQVIQTRAAKKGSKRRTIVEPAASLQSIPTSYMDNSVYVLPPSADSDLTMAMKLPNGKIILVNHKPRTPFQQYQVKIIQR